MLLENTAAGKLIEIDENVPGSKYYDIIPTNELPGVPCPVESTASTSDKFILRYVMPMLHALQRDTLLPSNFIRETIKPGDVTHVAFSFNDDPPRLEAIKFRGSWFKSEP